MLVISRRPGEIVRIQTPCGDIEVMLVRIGHEQSRIGITAPCEFTILRGEVLDRDAAGVESKP